MLNHAENVKVSVIIPTFNCDRYITQAIDSVLTQTYPDYEIIVIDDGSTDKTHQVLEPYLEKIRYIYQDNQGVSVARNRGIESAQGELVAFLDSDDLFLPEKLAHQVAIFDEAPELGIVHSGWRRVNQDADTIKDEEPWHSIPKLDLETWLRWKPIGTMGTLMFRRHWLLEAGGFQAGLGHAEDVDLLLRLALRGCQADWLREVTICYRQHDRNTMRDGLSQARSINKVLDKFFAQTELPFGVRLLEKQVRYNTFVWSSWYLYFTGFPREMVEYLQKSWEYSPYLPVETAIHWVESFANFSQNMGEDLDVDKLARTFEWQELMQWAIPRSVRE